MLAALSAGFTAISQTVISEHLLIGYRHTCRSGLSPDERFRTEAVLSFVSACNEMLAGCWRAYARDRPRLLRSSVDRTANAGGHAFVTSRVTWDERLAQIYSALSSPRCS